MRNRVDIKPISVNVAFEGKRFKTKAYKQFEKDCLLIMPKIKLPPPPYRIDYIFAFSSKLADLGNPEKLVTDTLCMKYNFDDRDIYEMNLKKVIVQKGKEYFEFEIRHLDL
jgi:hypothetical protein